MKLGSGGPREQRTIALVVVLGIGILWVYFNYVVAPLGRSSSSLASELRKAREQLKSLENATSNETTLRTQYEEVNQSVASLRKLMPMETELPSVIESLSDLAGQSQLKIQTIFPLKGLESQVDLALVNSGRPSESAVYKEVLIQIDALAGFHQLGTFLSLVEADQKPMRLASLRISQSPKESKRQTVKLMIKAYFSTAAGAASSGLGLSGAPSGAP